VLLRFKGVVMRGRVAIEDIDNLRRLAGINDVDLRDEIRGLRAGDHVKLIFRLAAGPGTGGEPLRVRITSVRGEVYRGRLVDRPSSTALASLQAGALVRFTTGQIHSVVEAAQLRTGGSAAESGPS
jgi:hypothetical protein